MEVKNGILIALQNKTQNAMTTFKLSNHSRKIYKGQSTFCHKYYVANGLL
jgi:hypothetical protein